MRRPISFKMLAWLWLMLPALVSARIPSDSCVWCPMGDANEDLPASVSRQPGDFALGLRSGPEAGSSARIVYAVPDPAQVTIRLFDVTGREVRTLIAGQADAGVHEIDLRAPGLAGGIYYCHMDARGFSATRRVLLLR